MNEHELDRRLDERLRASFAPPPGPTFAATAQTIVGARRPRRVWPFLLAAAVILVTVLVGWLATASKPRGPEGHDGRQLGALWAAAYQDAVARGFTNMSCCDPSLDVPTACRKMFDCALEMTHSGPVTLVGCSCGGATGGSITILTRSGGAPVCVHVVPRGADPQVSLPAGCGLGLARRELGELVLYALAPEPAPAVLEQFVVPTQ